MIPIIDFFEEAKNYGVVAMTGEGTRMDTLSPPGTGGIPSDFDPDAVLHGMFPNRWDKETARRFLDSLKGIAAVNDTVECVGHPDYWLMLASRYVLKDCKFLIGMLRDRKTLVSGRYSIGSVPNPGQPVGFDLLERGDSILLTVNELSKDFDYLSEEIIAPTIPKNKRLYIRMGGQRLVHVIPSAVTYGDQAEAIYMDYADECRCCISHVSGVEVGDTVPNPFVDIPYHINVVG